MVYDTFAVFFNMGPYCNTFLKKYVRNYQNCSELSKIDPFIGELPNEIWRAKIWSAFHQGLQIGFHQYALSAETWRISGERWGKDVAVWPIDDAWQDGGMAKRRIVPYVAYGPVWCRFDCVCVGICPNYRWYLTVVQNFQKWFILLPGFDERVWNFQKFTGCLENGSFKRESAYLDQDVPKNTTFGLHIKQIRVLVDLILLPEMKAPKIVPDPNKYQ